MNDPKEGCRLGERSEGGRRRTSWLMPVPVHRPEHAAADHKRPVDLTESISLICGLLSGIFGCRHTRPAALIETGQLVFSDAAFVL